MKLRWLALVLLLAPGLHAQNVAEDVLKGKEITGIEFKNYVGPHKVIESRQAIQGIGSELGSQLKASGTGANYGDKYRVVRVVDPSSPLLSADLFILDAAAGVDHIRNLNWILSAYMQQAFGYGVADADLLADFITRYNAFYRGRAAYYAATYSPQVVAALVPPESAGLSLDYRDWAGRTRMLIPLRNSLSKGTAGSVNTEEISNKDIVKDMGQTPESLAARKDLANLKEGEIVQEQKAIAQKEAQLTAPTAGSPPTDTKTPADATATPATTGSAAAGSGAATTPAAGTAGAAAPADTKAGASTSGSSTPTTAAALASAKAELAQRDAALQAERKDIVAATTKTPDTTTPAVATKPAVTVALVAVQDSTKLGQVVLVDPATNKVWKRSELNTVRLGRVQAFGDGWLVTAGDTKASNGAIRLVVLNKDDLSVALTGTDEVSPDAQVLVQGTQILTLTKNDKGQWLVGLFDSKLKSTTKGTDVVSPSTPITVSSAGVFVQAPGGKLMLLDAATLKKKSDTEG